MILSSQSNKSRESQGRKTLRLYAMVKKNLGLVQLFFTCRLGIAFSQELVYMDAYFGL